MKEAEVEFEVKSKNKVGVKIQHTKTDAYEIQFWAGNQFITLNIYSDEWTELKVLECSRKFLPIRNTF